MKPKEREGTTAQLAQRIAQKLQATFGDAPLDRVLAELLPGNELTTLLLHALRERSFRRDWRSLRSAAEQTRMTHASALDARVLHRFEGLAYDAASAFTAVDLAPVEPLGTAALVGIDPNNVLCAPRFVEVASDAATGLLHHAAHARAKKTKGTLRYCASQRVLRLQPLSNPMFTPHFRLFALATATRSTAAREDDTVEYDALCEQLQAWIRLFAQTRAHGFKHGALRIALSDTRLVAAVLRSRGLDPVALSRRVMVTRPESEEAVRKEIPAEIPRDALDPVAWVAEQKLELLEQQRLLMYVERVQKKLEKEHPEVQVRWDFSRIQGLNYYQGPFVQLLLDTEFGSIPVGDGGAAVWLAKLRSDERERFIATGIGAEVMAKVLAPAER